MVDSPKPGPPRKKPVTQAAKEEEVVPVEKYYLLKNYIKYCYGHDDKFISDAVELATRMNAPDNTVMWVEDESVEYGIRWVDRDEVHRDTPVFMSVLEDRLK